MTIQEIFVHIAAMKKNGRHRQSYTNFFAQTDGDYSIVESRDSIVFWQTGEDNVCRIYFFCFDLDELSRQLSQVENDSILDYIGECSDSLSHAFHAGGFRQYDFSPLHFEKPCCLRHYRYSCIHRFLHL